MGKATVSWWAAKPADRPSDTGSVTPLVLGMTFCLLLLGAGITAAGSAFLAQQNLRSMCDGAAAAAANAGPGLQLAIADPLGGPEQIANDYLQVREPDVTATTTTTDDTVRVVCRHRAHIAFGELFGTGTLDLSVLSVGRPLYQ